MLGFSQALSRVRPRPVHSRLRLIPGRKILQVQSIFSFGGNFSTLTPGSSSSSITAAASSSSSTHPFLASTPFSTQTAMQQNDSSRDIDRILTFWFTPPQAPTHWFRSTPTIDQNIATEFLPLIEAGRAHQLDHWTATPRGSLALIILLDQFPRNVFRGSGEAHASDARACEMALQAVACEFDRQIGDDLMAMFFYLPLMHDETISSQVACVALIEALAARCDAGPGGAKDFVLTSLAFAKSHRDTIVRFGRFPSRNSILGRPSTDDETTFLQENPSGWV